MKTIKCQGTAYAVGRQRALQMLQLGVYEPELYKQGLSEQRIDYAKECIRLYEAYDSNVIEELNGFCEALRCDVDELHGFLLGMYACTSDVFCSCFAYTNENQTCLGRNSDFLKAIKPYCLQEQIQINGLYSYIAHTTAFIELEDGMNEHGFSVGLTYVRPKVIKAGFNAGMLVRDLLGHCKSVQEALKRLEVLPIGSSQTLTMADALGHIAVVECNCEHVEVISSSPVVYATNAFHSEAMRTYCLAETLDDLRSEQRWHTLSHALDYRPVDLPYAKEVLQGKHGFLCQYPDFIPADTVWSVLYLPVSKEIYFVDGNPKDQEFTAIQW